MRIAEKYLAEIIDQGGRLAVGPVTEMGVLRLALDLRAARETIAQLEAALKTTVAAKPRRLLLVTEEVVTGQLGDPRGE